MPRTNRREFFAAVLAVSAATSVSTSGEKHFTLKPFRGLGLAEPTLRAASELAKAGKSPTFVSYPARSFQTFVHVPGFPHVQITLAELTELRNLGGWKGVRVKSKSAQTLSDGSTVVQKAWEYV